MLSARQVGASPPPPPPPPPPAPPRPLRPLRGGGENSAAAPVSALRTDTWQQSRRDFVLLLPPISNRGAGVHPSTMEYGPMPLRVPSSSSSIALQDVRRIHRPGDE